ncbi:MAG: two-component regulator propeller domain-containing protein, partial [Bacteroidota bacterium]
MAWKRYGILFFLLLATAGMLWSQEEFEKLNFVNIKEGISKRAVSSIIRDHYGFTWIGTSGAGLHRYDGINYKAYTYDWKDENSINSDLVYCIYLDGKNRLWIGTDNGLNVYKRDMDTFERIDLRSALSPGSDGTVVIRCLLEDNNGNLLVGTVNEGLIKVHPDDLKVSKVASDGPPDRLFQISALIKNKQGAIYAATDIGLKTYNEHEHSLSQSKFNTGGLVKEIKEPLESLLVDNTNNLWLGTRVNGIIRIREQHNSYQITAFPISKKRILSMLYINENMMLCGTENDGLIVIDKDGRILQKYMYNKFDNNSLKSNSIWSLHLDNENRIWLGYFNKGIGIHDKLYNKFERIESLPNNTSSLQAGSVTGIVKDASGKLWISMEGGGVDIYDPVTKEFQHINSNDKKHYSGLETDEIITIFIDSRENTWLCSWNGGIYFLKKGAKKFVNYSVQSTNGAITSDNIFDITEDSRGIIWIASFVHGLHYYDPEKDQFFHCNSEPFVTNGLVNSDIRVVLADSDDTIWLGATDGLYRVTFHEDRTFSVISMRAKMSRELKDHPGTHHILTLYESKDKRIWIGTDGGGLFVFHPENQEISRIKDIEGFNEKAVSSITESSDGVLWISGKSGITKLELNTNTATNFTADDGLLGNDFNNNAVFNDDDKILYFGSYRGINYVDPNQIAINKNPPSLYLT